MDIRLEAVTAYVTSATIGEKSWIKEALTFTDARASVKAYMGFGSSSDTRVCLYNLAEECFPSGMLADVRAQAKLDGIDLHVTDARTIPPNTIPIPPLTWLRDYQRNALDACLKHYNGVVKVGTGGGKTEIAVGLVESVATNWLFVVNREQLVNQAAERYKLRTGLDVGEIDAPMKGHGLTVATFQSLWARLKRNCKFTRKWLASVGGVIVDECHTLPADTFRAVLAACGATYRIGFSATPFSRGDRRSMFVVAQLGCTIYEVPAKELIEKGVLAAPNIRMIRCYAESESRVFATVYKELVVKSKQRNRLVMNLAVSSVKPCIIFIRLRNHGLALTKTLAARGAKVEFVDGQASAETRKAAVVRLEHGEVDILIASTVFNAGVDIPTLRSVVMAAGGASTIETLQRIGRGMRVAKGKTAFDVFDVFDEGNKYMERHAKTRMRSYKSEGYGVAVEDPTIDTPP